MTLHARDFKIFVPAKDFELCLSFYLAFGATLNWRDGNGLADLQLGGQRFLLQNFYTKDWAENFMIYLVVDNADAWCEHARALVDSGKYAGLRVQEAEDKDWGDRVGYVWDPSGVLIHIAQPRDGFAEV